ncbi:hypothetical protein PHBOTO_001488 [Pseudozyma hubeiensis]|nr:hypothetical protein PHBOTO_001488 [Pseudozyma hubeiensis]
MILFERDRNIRIRLAQPATGARQSLTELDVSNPSESDVEFILRAYDSTLPYLSAIGSEEQWGTKPFSSRPDTVAKYTTMIDIGYRHHSNFLQTGLEHPEQSGVFLCEVKNRQQLWTRKAALQCASTFPDYVPERLADQATRQAKNYVYLNSIITDRRAGPLEKRALEALYIFGLVWAQQFDKTMVYGDVWAGNGGSLLKYYRDLGGSVIGTFEVQDKHGPGMPWTGYLVRKDLPPELGIIDLLPKRHGGYVVRL